MELQETGLEPIGIVKKIPLIINHTQPSFHLILGTWNPVDRMNLSRISEESVSLDPVNIMANKTFVVGILIGEPYAMLKEDKQQLYGNDRYEGFAIDMFDEMAKRLQFNVTYKIIDDGKYGSRDRNTGKWNGAMGEVLRGPEEGGVDFAVFDLTITSSRAEAVTFSMPFLNLGISIMFIKPRKAPPSLMSWMAPFTLEVWVWIVLGKQTYRVTHHIYSYILFWEFPCPAWAVASCSSGPQAGGTPQMDCNRI